MNVSRALLVVYVTTACNLVDDEPPSTSGTTDQPADNSTDTAGACIEAANNSCPPPYQSAVQWIDQGGSVVLLDDPAATITLASGALLVRVNSSVDFVGTYEDNGAGCTATCSFCLPGQSLCMTGFDDNGYPECFMCLEFDGSDVEAVCNTYAETCLAGGNADTGGEEDTGALDETGSSANYDCTGWTSTATAIDETIAVIDRSIVNELLATGGLPLSECEDTRFRSRSDGYFQLSSRSPDGLLALMNLEIGDTFLKFNNEPLNSVDAILDAVNHLASSDQPSTFQLIIHRGTTDIAKTVQLQ